MNITLKGMLLGVVEVIVDNICELFNKVIKRNTKNEEFIEE